jgi:FKBP-type peptidyl-prolyl cis-trans isomerase (trigger factor)
MPAAPAVEAPALDLESVVGEPAAASVVPDLSLAEVAAAPASLPEAGLAGVRDAVTERVARDLARELSEKLMERIEKVIWEVVPDLAEVLIAREIERIRRMAEEQKSA